MRVTERILLALSRSPEEGDYAEAVDAGEVGEALDSLRRYFPDLSELVRGAGCWTSAAGAAGNRLPS